MHFPTDVSEVFRRIESIDTTLYQRTRNYTNGAVSYLSPYICRGVISLTQIKEIVLQRNQLQNSYRFLQELAWREYFQRVWEAKGDAIFTDLKSRQQYVKHHKMIAAIQQATTGIDAIDTAILNMVEYGYMHNHVRMYTAGLACNFGAAHWWQPSRWMYYYLLDGDLASNSLNWQWIAGTFSSKKYVFNQENVNKFTGIHQQNTFIDTPYESLPLHEIPAELAALNELTLKTVLPLFGEIVLDPHIPTFVYNAYNLDPLWRADEEANRVLLLEPKHYANYPVSKHVLDFTINLSKNIPGIKILVANADELQRAYPEAVFISKEHPANNHYPGKKDERDWLFPEVDGYFASFSKYWKICERMLFGQTG